MYCMKCGKEIPEGSAFCTGCGAPIQVTGGATQHQSLPAQAPVATRKKRRGWLIALIGLGSVTLLSACVVIGIFVVAPQLNHTSKHPTAAPSAPPSAALPDKSAAASNKAGFHPTVPGRGESLYVGTAAFDGVGTFKAAFILSADGGTIHDMTLYLEDLKVQLKRGSSTTTVTLQSVTETYRGSYPVGETETRIDLGKSKIDHMVFVDGGAYGEMDYIYIHRDMNSGSAVDVPLGTAKIEFEKSGGGESAPSTKDTPAAVTPTDAAATDSGEKAGETAQITFEDKTYTVSIGQINMASNGVITVEVRSTGIGTVLPFRNGKMIVPVQAKIMTDGTAVKWKTVRASADSLIFEFAADHMPEQIILYPHGKEADPNASVTFDAATKNVIP